MTILTGKTQDDVRRLALSLPEAVEQRHFDRPSFRVGGKIFATLPPPADASDHRVVLLRIPPPIKEALQVSEAQAWVSLGNWGKGGAMQLAIDHLEWDKLADLVRMAWRKAAPAALRTSHAKELGEGA